MAELKLPDPRYRESFVAAMAEFAAEGRGGPDDDSMIGRDQRRWGSTWRTPEGFSAYLDDLALQPLEETHRDDGFVPSTTWWWVDGVEYLGRIALRHRLNQWLLEEGGHIGYDVRPSARRRGHATAMLAALLPEAHARGVDPALITCDFDNVASKKVIEGAGGVFEDRRRDKLRYWVPTATSTAAVTSR